MNNSDQASRSREMRHRIFKIQRLAAMPQVVWELINAVGEEQASAPKIERIIESDPALASRVLSLANSAYYSLPQRATTIRRAVVVIGFQELRLLALGAGLAEVFDQRKVPEAFDGRGLWIHCLSVSWLAKEMAVGSGRPDPGEVGVAGLLHDLGKLILATNFQEELAEMLKLIDQGRPYFEAEEEMGLKHATAGYYLAKRWDLPDVHVAAIRDHHDPKATDPYYVSTGLVALADCLAKGLGFGLVHQARPIDLPAIMEAARLAPSGIKKVVDRARVILPSMLEVWSATVWPERDHAEV